MVPFAGYEMPIQYEGISLEHNAVRNAVGIFDVSHMGELILSGPYSGDVVDYLVTSDATQLVDGQAMYTCACNVGGTILDDLLVYRFNKERWMVVCNAANHDKIATHVAKLADQHCDFDDQTATTSLLAVQGPKSFDVLSRFGGEGPKCAELGSFHLGKFDLEGVPCIVARTGYTGEDGVEIFCANEHAVKLWTLLLKHGQASGIKPAGLGCRDTLRLEARLSLYGNEIDETTHPIEAGLKWIVKLDAGDFIGREALIAIKKQGLSRKIVGFEMIGRGIARHGYPLLDMDGNPVGTCTSGCPSPTLAKNIGLGFLPKPMTKVGTHFKVDCRGKHIEAVVVKTPFYKRAS
ncbi:MAG: glycine cleavage system protein T [Sorangium cellulosum]|nr:MAG: glycine cleavage system protein T [Sorangium cellulosum]